MTVKLINLLKAAEILALLAFVWITYVAVGTLKKVDTTLDQMNHNVALATGQVVKATADLDATTTKAEFDLDQQLTVANKTLALTSSNLDKQTQALNFTVSAFGTSAGSSLVATSQSVQKLANQSQSLLYTVQTTTIPSVNEVVSNPDIPKLILDSRRTMALAGNAMSHVEGTANTIAEEAPALSKHIEKIADAGDKIATEVTKPHSKWQKFFSALAIASGVAGPLKVIFGL